MQALKSRPLHWFGNHDRVGQIFLGLTVAALAAGLTSVLQSRGFLFGMIAVIAVLGSLWFVATKHTLFALAVLMLYLGLLDGYLKLATGNNQISAIRDVLLYALVVGLLIRAQVTEQEWALPPLAGWVVAFVILIFAQLLNPNAGTLAHSLGGIRQHLEFVPLFFLAYMFIRTTRLLRYFVILMLVIAAANGIASYVQFNQTPKQFAAWGPGYEARIDGIDAFTGGARVFADAEGTERVRPFGLGSDSGSGGLFGALAIAGAFALGALVGRLRYQLLAVALAIGATIAVVTSQGRGAVVCAVIAVVAYGIMSATSQKRITSVIGITIAGLVCFVVFQSIISDNGTSSFRYRGLAPTTLLETTDKARHGGPFDAIEYASANFPLGAGLAAAGPAAGQPGGTALTNTLNAESEYSFLIIEGGIPALIIIIGFTLTLAVLGIVRIRREPDPDARLLLAAIIAPIVGMLALYYPSPITATVPTGPYLWTAGGIVAYWLVDRQRASTTMPNDPLAPPPAG